MIVPAGTTSQSIDVQIVDDTGLPVTGLVAATFPSVSWSIAGNTAATAVALSDLAAITSAYSSGGIKERSGGYYRLDLPNAMLANAGETKLLAEATGKHLICEPIQVGTVTVGGYSTGEDPASLVLETPANKLATDIAGRVAINVTFPSNFSVMNIDGSGNVASLPQDGSISNLTFAASAITAIQSGLATSATAAAIKAKTDLIATNSADSPNAVTAQGSIATLAANYTVARAAKLDDLDATVSSRLAAGSYVVPPTAAQNAAAVWQDTTAGDFTAAGSAGAKLFSLSGGGGTGGSAGTGNIVVDQDTGGTDNLRAVDANGNGIDQASITAYLTSDWTANPLTATQRGQSFTKTDGRWATVMMLDAGAYTFVIEATGYQTSIMTATVS